MPSLDSLAMKASDGSNSDFGWVGLVYPATQIRPAESNFSAVMTVPAGKETMDCSRAAGAETAARRKTAM